MTKLFLIATALLTAAASPVVARELRVPATDTSRAVDGAATAAPAARPNQKYCIIDTPTGSHIPHRVCQTRQQWLDDGFDPTAKN